MRPRWHCSEYGYQVTDEEERPVARIEHVGDEQEQLLRAELITRAPLLADCVEAIRLLNRPGNWSGARQREWDALTGGRDASAQALYDWLGEVLGPLEGR